MLSEYIIDHIEIYTPMAKALAYWHVEALGFTMTAFTDAETGVADMSSYVLESDQVRLVLTAVYPTNRTTANQQVSSFIAQHYCSVKRIALRTTNIKQVFNESIENNAIPIKFPTITQDESGSIEEAAIKLYDNNEIVFIDRSAYLGSFKPGYKARVITNGLATVPLFSSIDHIASHSRINEIGYWTNYVNNILGTGLVQSITKSAENRSGMVMNINQSPDKAFTLVMAEPASYLQKSNVQNDIEIYGPGIHHLAFATNDLPGAIEILSRKHVEFMGTPASYYDLLRDSGEFNDIDLDALQRNGILIDKEDDTYLLQKFMKPISDRPSFIYELVQRVNGYNGFALKNITMLRRAAEKDIMRTESV